MTEQLNTEQLVKMARSFAFQEMGGRRVGIYDVEDIAQEMLMKFLPIALREKVENPKALLHELAFQCFTAALRREQLRRTEGLSIEPADDCIIVQHWENQEIAREELVRLDVKNEYQRGIVTHALRGYDITNTEDRQDIAKCLGIEAGRLAVELHRLKKVERIAAPGLMTFIPTCYCCQLRMLKGWDKIGVLPLGFDLQGGRSDRSPG